MSQSRLPRTISPLVPTSMNSVSFGLVHARGQYAGGDVGAHVGAHHGQAVDGGLGIDVQADGPPP
jgi:hypothetical protein